MKKTIRNLFLKVPAVCLLSLSMLLTSCISVNNEMIPEESTVAETTENPIRFRSCSHFVILSQTNLITLRLMMTPCQCI